MGYRIQYNGFGNVSRTDWDNVAVDTYVSQPLTDDDEAHWNTRHTISGTATISSNTAADQVALLQLARESLNRQGATLQVYLGGTASSNRIVDTSVQTTGNFPNTSGGDDGVGTPIITFEITEQIGNITALVRFTITWHQYQVLSGENQNWHIQNHSWETTFDVDAAGMQTMEVVGALRVRPNIGTGSLSSSKPRQGPNPEKYRCIVVPALPEGFRVDNMRWGVSRDGRRLVYRVSFKQYARAMPSPAKDGNGTFTWIRSTTSPEDGGNGIKIFNAWMEAGPDVAPGQLAGALLQQAKKRISFGADVITEIRITERDIYRRNMVELSIAAIAGSNEIVPRGGSSPQGSQISTVPNFRILDDFGTSETPYEPPSPYGNALINATQRALFGAYLDYNNPNASMNAMPVAGTEQTDIIGMTSCLQYEPPVALFDELPTEPSTGTEKVDDEHKMAPYLRAETVENVIVNTGVKVIRSMDFTLPDRVFQHVRPVLKIVSRVIVQRKNKAPASQFLLLPPGGVLISQTANVTAGVPDINNNRIFTGRYERVIEVRDTPGSNLFTTQGGLRQHTFEQLAATYDYRRTGDVTERQMLAQHPLGDDYTYKFQKEPSFA